MSTISKRRSIAAMLGFLLYMIMANLVIVQTSEVQIFPGVGNGDKLVIEAGSTLTLTCIYKLDPLYNGTELEWTFATKKDMVAK